MVAYYDLNKHLKVRVITNKFKMRTTQVPFLEQCFKRILRLVTITNDL